MIKHLLPRSGSHSPAKQCREMGLQVGDTIIGRETYSNGHWSEAKLTLLFTGNDLVVWQVMRRNNEEPCWLLIGEESNWTLGCRGWWKVQAAD